MSVFVFVDLFVLALVFYCIPSHPWAAPVVTKHGTLDAAEETKQTLCALQKTDWIASKFKFVSESCIADRPRKYGVELTTI